MSPTISPRPTVRSTRSLATRPPKRFVSPRTSSSDCAVIVLPAALLSGSLAAPEARAPAGSKGTPPSRDAATAGLRARPTARTLPAPGGRHARSARSGGAARRRRVVARGELSHRRPDLPVQESALARAPARRARQAPPARPLGHLARDQPRLRAPEQAGAVAQPERDSPRRPGA